MDAPTTHAVCGDGIVDVATEGCDDGNTTSGDGCSSTCQIETVNKCGNGQIDGTETCDDGNQASSDGCSAQCTVESGYMCTGTPSVCTLMTSAMGTCANPMAVALTLSGSTYSGTGAGDTSNATNQVTSGNCDMLHDSGGGFDQIWTFTNPVAGPVLITIHGASTNFDSVLRLTTTVCDVATQVPDDLLPADQTSGTSDGCADLHGSGADERLNYNNLPAGTYYLVIDGYGANEDGPYTFSINAGHGTCGNGVVEFDEACDDHNTTAGDGCDATCHVQAGYGCTGSPSVCVLTCGNGLLDAGETCDDHNTTANDGCSATCQLETGYGTCAMPLSLTFSAQGAGHIATASGTTVNGTDQVHTGACDALTMSGAGNDQIWKFVNPIAQPVLITVEGGVTNFDAVLRMTTTACDVTTEVHDDVLPADTSGHSDGCADLHGSGTDERLNYNMLAAGTYYIVVDGYSATSNGHYTFNVKTGNTAVCGNGVIETGEVCDDHNTATGDGCGATCQVETGYVCTGAPSVCHQIVCGDGLIDAGEACDDHNAAAGDGCSATCQVETGYVCTGAPSVCHPIVCGDGIVDGLEECDSSGAHDRCDATCHLVFDTTDTENNNDAAHAQVITPVHHIIKGSLPIGDLDVYKFTLTAAATVEIETYTTFESSHTSSSVSALGLECKTADTQVRVFPSAADPTDDTAYTYYDDDDGDGYCSYVGPLDGDGDTTEGTLAAGTYYFTVHEYGSNDAIARYLVDFKVTP